MVIFSKYLSKCFHYLTISTMHLASTCVKYVDKPLWYILRLYQIEMFGLLFHVGIVGFEPTITCSQSRWDGQASLYPVTLDIDRRDGTASTRPNSHHRIGHVPGSLRSRSHVVRSHRTSMRGNSNHQQHVRNPRHRN